MTDITGSLHSPNYSAAILPLVMVAIWAATIMWLTSAGVFVDMNTSLPLRLMPAVIIPPAAFLLAYRLLPAVRAWVSSLDLALVVGIQIFRVIGIIFLFQWALGDLPAAFAAPAGFGDIAVGIFALIVTLRVARNPYRQARSIRALAFAGFVDFAAAFTFATLASRGMPLALPGTPLPLAAQTLPTSMIPTFAVPFFMIAHIISLLKLSELQGPGHRVSN
jgi:hypothetical protein